MSGINPDFRKELSRRESSINTLNEFLKYAKIEQDLYDTFEKSRNLSMEYKQPYFSTDRSPIPSLTAMINKSKQYYHHMEPNERRSYPTSTQRSVTQRNSIPEFGNRSRTIPNEQIRDNVQQFTFKKTQNNGRQTLQNKFSNCKICNRTNHRTIDCFHKQTTGCFKCGQPNHTIRDCPMLQNFQ